MLQLETDCDIKQTIGFGWSQTGKLLATMLTGRAQWEHRKSRL